jgi:hypothetical protein
MASARETRALKKHSWPPAWCPARNDTISTQARRLALRIYPLIMVISNRPLDEVTGSVKVSRPAETPHEEMGNQGASALVTLALVSHGHSLASPLLSPCSWVSPSHPQGNTALKI